MGTFARLSPRLREAIAARLGWTGLRPVQELGGEAILDGKNAVLIAPTAEGKTEAAVFPVLSALMDAKGAGIGAVYVAPLKALLNNQEERLGRYAEIAGLRCFVWHGDTRDAEKRRFVGEPAELLLTTPESLEVMLISPRVPAAQLFEGLRFVIVDEVHALAGTDRGAHLGSVIERLQRFTRHDLQRVGLSATVGDPAAILEWLGGASGREGAVVDPPRAPVRREILVVASESVEALGVDAARMAGGKKSLLFCQSRAQTEAVAERMRGVGMEVFVHHSSVSPEERRLAEERFARGASACIVCTSTLELGIDVGDCDLVLQANAPSTVSSFLQRMGRSGRRPGQMASMRFLCEGADAVLLCVALVELARERWVEPVRRQARCWPVLVHQLLALTLEHGGISADACWALLSRVPDLRGIGRAELDALIEHMVREGYLFRAGGLLSFGERAERTFGRRNFMELYAVFSTPALYRVHTASGKEIGVLEQGFVDRLVEEATSFLLGGRGWMVERVDHAERAVRVRPASSGRKPSWGAFLPQLLGFEVCQRMRRVLVEEVTYPYLHPSAKLALEERREELGPLLGRAARAVQVEPGAARWWTFAGGRVNHTLKYAIEVLSGWKVVADNVLVRIEGDGVTHGAVDEVVDRMAREGFWDDEGMWRAILARLPPYRLSKFQGVLPEAMAVEMVAGHLLDAEGTRAWLGASGSR